MKKPASKQPKEFTDADFRAELQKIMPGYKWTVRKEPTKDGILAVGIRSSGFNRLSTIEVERRTGHVWYKAGIFGHGTRGESMGMGHGSSLAQALRCLQDHLQLMAGRYLGLSNQMEEARKAE